ncbi:uncharacterized protein B0T23DRAFT_406344 [Neurospora hispaniola]|uniref:DUF6590 domain-containing protein n=1 Tax=Neurospora hispaniola TaxID=588809 RepID=A0AAJ0I3W5_9PEZI|nr:hypothetical protein B0T23DRAFT_406344 [Neurospora hispaniola]
MDMPARTSLPSSFDRSELEITARTRTSSSFKGSEMSVSRTATNIPMPMSEPTLPKEETTREVADVTDRTSSEKTLLSAVSTTTSTTAPGDNNVPKEPSSCCVTQSTVQPKAVKHKKPTTDYVRLKWERDSNIRDYVHRKDPMNCEQCGLGIHGEKVPIDGIVLRYSQYQKKDTQIDPPMSLTGDTTNDQAAALTIPIPQYLKIDKPRRFFTKGRIFKTVWFEPFGDYSASLRARPAELACPESCPNYNKEKPYEHFRWFVVIRKQLHHSLCFAIVNGGAKSMAKNRARGEHLAVLYSTSVPPAEPDKEEGIMFGPLAVILEEGKQNISPLARLDCSRVFTVEDDLKVMKIGRVHPDFHGKLDEYYYEACFKEPVKQVQANGT